MYKTIGGFHLLCDAGEALACTDYGFTFSQGAGVPADPARAASLYERACTLGAADGCFNLALLLRDGRGVPEDRVRSEALLRDTCEGGKSESCLMYGNAL